MSVVNLSKEKVVRWLMSREWYCFDVVICEGVIIKDRRGNRRGQRVGNVLVVVGEVEI